MMMADIRSDVIVSLAHGQIRLRDPSTGLYLHLAGQGTTSNSQDSGRGTLKQARILRERTRARGQPGPYRSAAR